MKKNQLPGTLRAFRADPDNAEGLKFIAVWFYHVAVVDVDDGIFRCPSADGSQVVF